MRALLACLVVVALAGCLSGGEGPRPAAMPAEPTPDPVVPAEAEPTPQPAPPPAAPIASAATNASSNVTLPGNTTLSPAANATVPPQVEYAAGMFEVRVDRNGTERVFKHYVPAGLAEGEPAPMLVMLHGGSGNPDQMFWKTRMQVAADQGRFHVLMPQGMPMVGSDDQFRWQSFCCGPNEELVDDPGFIRETVQWMVAAYAIDEARIGVTGHSEGGQMAYNVAARDPDEYRFVACVSGAIGQQPLPARPWKYIPAPAGPVNTLIIHATDDPQVPYEGGRGLQSPDPYVQKASVSEAIALFTAPLGNHTRTVVDDGELQVQTYRANATDHRVVHLRTVGGHGWPAGLESSQLPYSLIVSTPARPDATAVIAQWLTGELP